LRSNRFPKVLVVLLFALACAIGVFNQSRSRPEGDLPRARFDDASPLGGKGLRLVLANLGYAVKRADVRLKGMPGDARVWILLDPQTQFGRAESDALLNWIKNGGTLIVAATPGYFRDFSMVSATTPRGRLDAALGLQQDEWYSSPLVKPNDEPLPTLSPLNWNAPSVYRSGVKKATASGGTFVLNRPHSEIAGTPFQAEIARLDYGKGRVIITPDALLFTNYALAHDDNAVLVTNFVRAHMVPKDGAIYWDERNHVDKNAPEIRPNLAYYLWRPPLRWAILQLLGAGLLAWAFYGRRLGAAVPLPDSEPVTRASNFALAMGALFRKANRPRAASAIIGEEFRRTLVRRLGMSVADSDKSIAERAAGISGLPAPMIDRLLLRGKNPPDSEADALAIAQEMEIVIRRLSR